MAIRMLCMAALRYRHRWHRYHSRRGAGQARSKLDTTKPLCQDQIYSDYQLRDRPVFHADQIDAAYPRRCQSPSAKVAALP